MMFPRIKGIGYQWDLFNGRLDTVSQINTGINWAVHGPQIHFNYGTKI